MKYNDIKWEDEDSEFDGDEGERSKPKKEEVEDFAQLLNQDQFSSLHLRTGMSVNGTIISINDHSETVLIELDPQHTGVMDRQQILNDKGEQKYFLGDRINAYIISMRDEEIILSTSLSQSNQSIQDLRLAYQNRVPVKGKVTGENSGGFEVLVMGRRCFCPVSQIDARYVQVKAEYIGKEFNFLIEKIEEGGRNVVVSRSKLLEQEARQKLEELEQKLNQDLILDGSVTEVRDYGAFVDLGGIEGFLHVSEMSYSRISRAHDFVAKGDRVRVKVLSITTHEGKKRISLSMKAVDEDPWLNASQEFQSGQSFRGKVLRIEPYGAFVELRPGVEGLLHISEMSWEKRIHSPSEILKLGDIVNVRVLNIDNQLKKASLSLKHVEDDPWFSVTDKYPIGSEHKAVVERLKGFGAIVQLEAGITGLVPMATLKKAFGESYRKHSSPPKELDVVIRNLDLEEKKILLSLKGIETEDDKDDDVQEYMKKQEEKSTVSTTQRGTFGDLLAAKLKNQPTKS